MKSQKIQEPAYDKYLFMQNFMVKKIFSINKRTISDLSKNDLNICFDISDINQIFRKNEIH